MPEISIELPEADYQTALTVPQSVISRAVVETVNQYATARNKPNESDQEQPDSDEIPFRQDRVTNEDDLQDIREGLADVAAGHTQNWESVYAELKEHFQSKPETTSLEPDYDEPTTEQDLIDIGEGLKAEAEGRFESWDTIYARLSAGATS